MRFYIIIPAHNEEASIQQTLQSLMKQTHLPEKILVVNDNSTDKTAEKVTEFLHKYPFIKVFNNTSTPTHLPGGKVIQAFLNGLEHLDNEYDVLCKFDADLIFPPNYLAELKKTFESDKRIGMAGGFCYVKENGTWQIENLTNKDHIRGALKAYRKQCFQEIGGLKVSMGWDTVDELLAKYHGWEVNTIKNLHVKHLRPTGKTYTKAAKHKQGEAFYKLRYGFTITFIASLKLALLKKKPSLLKEYLAGFLKAKKNKLPYLVNAEVGKWIRKYRWKKIKQKLF